MIRVSRTAVAAAVALLAGCVVIPKTFDANINVTIHHVQEQAEGIIKFVEGETDTLPEIAPSAQGEKKSSLIERALDVLDPVPTAYAAEVHEDSARVKQIATSMKARFPEVEAAKKTGAVGENNRGFLELVKADAITDADKKNAVQRTIAAENDDRKALYQEIARLNSDQNMTVTTVERVYAQKRLERAKSGEMFQLPPAGPDMDAFAASAVGKKLAGGAAAGAWVTIP
jgi:hypothetical protein